MALKYYWVFIHVLFLVSIKAQDRYYGVVVDEDSMPIFGASLTFYGMHQDSIHIETDENGHYNAVFPCRMVKIEFLGYEPHIFQPMPNIDETIVMQPLHYHLDEIVFLGKELMPYDRFISLATKLDQLSSGVSIDEPLNQIAGINMQSGGLNTNKVSVRGIGGRSQFASSGLKMFYKGIPLHSATGESTVEDLGMNLGSNIHAVKGYTGTDFEAGFGGAIVIGPLIEIEKDLNLWSKNSIGPWGLIQTRNGITKQFEHQNSSSKLAIYQSHIKSDGYRENNKFKRKNYTLDYTFQKRLLSINLLLNYIDLFSQIPSSLSLSDFNNSPKSAAPSWAKAKGYEDYAKCLLGTSVFYHFHPKWNFTQIFFANGFKSEELRPFNTTNEQTLSLGSRGYLEYFDKSYAPKFKMQLGYSLVNEKYELALFETKIDQKGMSIGNSTEHRRILQFYLNSEIQALRKITLRGGCNVQNAKFIIDKKDLSNHTFLLPELALNYGTTSTRGIFMRVGKGVNYFSPSEAILPDGIYDINLSPSLAWTFNMGISQSFKNIFTYRLELYQFWASHILSITRDTLERPISNTDGKAIYRGVEAELNAKLLNTTQHRLELCIGANSMDNRFTNFKIDNQDFSNNKLPGTPQSSLYFLASGKFKNWFASTRMTFQSETYLNDANTDLSSAFHLIHASLGYNIVLHPSFTFVARIDGQNLGNAKYSSLYQVNAASFNGSEPRYYYPGLPINFIFHIEIKTKI